MPRFAPWIPCVLALAAGASFVAPASAADYGGRCVDGKYFNASAAASPYGTFEDVQVKFQGERVYIRFPHGLQIIAILEDERIDDPHEVIAQDDKRDLTWVLDVRGLD